MPKMSGARLFAEVMHGYGVTHVFYVPTILMRALAEMDELKIHKVMTHGEKAAAYMADGYARTTGKVGLCMVTCGPGLTQCGTSLIAANRVLCISSSTSRITATAISRKSRRWSMRLPIPTISSAICARRLRSSGLMPR